MCEISICFCNVHKMQESDIGSGDIPREKGRRLFFAGSVAAALGVKRSAGWRHPHASDAHPTHEHIAGEISLALQRRSSTARAVLQACASA